MTHQRSDATRSRGRPGPPEKRRPSRKVSIVRSNNEIRQVLLEYFYERNKRARSARSDRSGAAAKISVIRRELKASHGLSQSEIRSNLTYLTSQDWVGEEQIQKSVPLKSGMIIPQVTSYYKITAHGIDKIEGTGEFTMSRFHGIKIEATGQSIITIGDGNQVDARHSAPALELAELKKYLLARDDLAEAEKLGAVADIETIQSQLAKPTPNRSVVSAIWSGVERIATTVGLAANAARVSELLKPILS